MTSIAPAAALPDAQIAADGPQDRRPRARAASR